MLCDGCIEFVNICFIFSCIFTDTQRHTALGLRQADKTARADDMSTKKVYIWLMSEEQKSLTGRKDLAPVPEPGMSEDQLAQFIPHRALRPEKTEGGKAFGFSSDFEPAGDQPRRLANWCQALKPASVTKCCLVSPVRAKLLRWRKSSTAPSVRRLFLPRTKLSRTALWRVQSLLSGKCGRVFRVLLRLLPTGSLCASH